MAVKKISFNTKINGDVNTYYPQTSADVVLLTDGSTTVQSAIENLRTRLAAVESTINPDGLYMTANGMLLDDGDENNLVAIH